MKQQGIKVDPEEVQKEYDIYKESVKDSKEWNEFIERIRSMKALLNNRLKRIFTCSGSRKSDTDLNISDEALENTIMNTKEEYEDIQVQAAIFL